MKKQRSGTARQGRAIRRDATVDTTERKIERFFKLPKRSVRIVLPKGRVARVDKRVDSLLRDYRYEA